LESPGFSRGEEVNSSVEQEARDILDRMGVPGAQQLSTGTVVELANLVAEARHLRAQVAELLPYASAGADALDSWEPYGDVDGAAYTVLQEGADAMLDRIRAGEFGTPPGVSAVGDPTGRPGGSLPGLDGP
jgi:hypothetical protein